MQQGTRNVSRAINLFWENSVKIHKWQWAARRSQCYWLNFKRGIPKKTLTLRPLDYTKLRFTVYLHNLFTTPATVIWHKTSPLFCATKSTIWPTAATFSYRNTQPHFTLFHYNSLISLCGITVLQHDHTGRLYTVILPHHVHRKISSWLEHYHFS